MFTFGVEFTADVDGGEEGIDGIKAADHGTGHLYSGRDIEIKDVRMDIFRHLLFLKEDIVKVVTDPAVFDFNGKGEIFTVQIFEKFIPQQCGPRQIQRSERKILGETAVGGVTGVFPPVEPDVGIRGAGIGAVLRQGTVDTAMSPGENFAVTVQDESLFASAGIEGETALDGELDFQLHPAVDGDGLRKFESGIFFADVAQNTIFLSQLFALGGIEIFRRS